LHCTVLNLSEDTFWHSTPRKLFGLFKIHRKVNGIDDEEEKNKLESIENILF
jgi:hypothetical protein